MTAGDITSTTTASAPPAARSWPALALAAVATALGAVGCGADLGAPEAGDVGGATAPAEVTILVDADDLVRVARRQLEIRVPVSGTFRPLREATLAPAETGTVLRLGPDSGIADDAGSLPVGTYVRRGDALVTLENRALRQDLVRMSGQLEMLRFRLFGNGDRTNPDPDAELLVARRTAEVDHERLRQLTADRAIPQAQVDATANALARVRAAYDTTLKHLDALEAEYELLRERTANLIVRAPFAGRVARVHVEVGEHVPPGGPVVSLIDDSRLDLVCGLPEALAPYVVVGETGVLPVARELGVDALRVSEVGPRIDEANRTVTLRARFTNPPRNPAADDGPAAPRAVASGRFVNAVVVLNVSGLFVPDASVRLRDGRDIIFVAGRDGRIDRRTVRRGVAGNGQVQVVSNLQPGEYVISRGLTGMRHGMRFDLVGELDDDVLVSFDD